MTDISGPLIANIMNALQITSNGTVLFNVGAAETGRFCVLISFETKDGRLNDHVDVIGSGYIPETGEHRKWESRELALPTNIEIRTGVFEPSPYIVFDPSAKVDQEADQ